MLTWVVTILRNSSGPSPTLRIPVSALCPAIGSLQLPVSSVEPPESNRKSEIRNSNKRRNFSSFHFSNRKFLALLPSPLRILLLPLASLQPLGISTHHSSLATDFLTGTPRLEISITPTISAISNFLIGTKRWFSPPSWGFPGFATRFLRARFSIRRGEFLSAATACSMACAGLVTCH